MVSDPTPVGDLPFENDAVLGNLERAHLAVSPHQEWARSARRCVEVLEGDQWDRQELMQRRQQRRPALTLNRVAPLYKLVHGLMVQRRTAITYRPGDDRMSSDAVATVLTKLSMAIANRQRLRWRQAELFQDGMTTGRGFIDVRASFENNVLGECRISTRNPFLVFPDPEADTYESSGWRFVFEAPFMSLADILVTYGAMSARQATQLVHGGPHIGSMPDGWFYGTLIEPKTYFGLLSDLSEQRASWYDRMFGSKSALGAGSTWFVDPTRKLLRVMDCQHRVLSPINQFVDLSSGEAVDIPEDWTDERISAAMQWAQQQSELTGQPNTLTVRRTMKQRWRWTVTAGETLLFDDWSPYDGCTIQGYFPYFRRGRTIGMVHDLLDPQEEINRRRSAMAEIVSKVANGGWIYEEGSLDAKQEDNLRQFGSTPGVQVKYRAGRQKPEPITPAVPQGTHTRLEQMAMSDLKEISNVNDSALGQVDRVQSGAAIIARQRQAVIGLEMYFDNLDRTLHEVGLQQLRVIRAFYTQERVFRERGDEASDLSMWAINQRLADGTIANDVTRGSYEVVVDRAPLLASFDDLEFETLINLAQAGIPVPPEQIVQAAPIRRKKEIIAALQMANGGVPGGQPVAPPVGPAADSPPMEPTRPQPPGASAFGPRK